VHDAIGTQDRLTLKSNDYQKKKKKKNKKRTTKKLILNYLKKHPKKIKFY